MDRRIRIPKTSLRRGADGYVKLIERLAPNASDGFGVFGKILKPGALVTFNDLRPTDAFPLAPVIVEYVPGANQPLQSGWKRHSQPDLYIAWRWDGHETGWTELARSMSTHATWVVEMGPILRRALDAARGPQPVKHRYEAEAAIAAALDAALSGLSPADQRAALAALHDQIALRIARAA